MVTASSIQFLRQASSQGAAQIRPQMEARGFDERAARKASSYCSSAMSWT
jgi:hypothetical protein